MPNPQNGHPAKVLWQTKSKSLGGITPTEFMSANLGMSDADMSRVFTKAGIKISTNGVKNKRKRDGHHKNRDGTVIAESPFTRYDSPPTVTGDALILGDVEFPFHQADFMNRCIGLARAWKIDTVIFNGDLLHHDRLSSFNPNWDGASAGMSEEALDALHVLSGYLSGKLSTMLSEIIEKHSPQASPPTISEEWRVARSCLRSMRQVFKRAVLVMGNHEGRLLNALQSPMAPSDILRLLGEDDGWMITGPYYFGVLNSGDREWRFTHPKNTSIIPARIAAELADKFGQNVLQSHNHLWGLQQSRSGRYLGAEIGCCVDGARLAYYAQRDTTRPMWQNGAAIIRGGFCHMLHPTWTDWERLASQS